MGPKGITIAVFCLGVAGCMSFSPPIDRLAASAESIRSATEMGAAQVGPASVYLKLAREELGNGRTMIEAGDNEGADLQLLRAQADAELAFQIARDSRARMAVAPAPTNLETGPKTDKPKELP